MAALVTTVITPFYKLQFVSYDVVLMA